MALRRNILHPSFIIGACSFLVLFMGVIFLQMGWQAGDYLIGSSFVLGGIHWIWSIIDVARDPELKGGEHRVFWLSLVIIVAPVMGMVYYMMRRKRVSI